MTKADYSNIPVSVTQFPTGLDDYCNTCTTEEAPLSFKLWYQRDRYVTGRELSRCCHSFTKAVFAIAIDRAHGQNNIRGEEGHWVLQKILQHSVIKWSLDRKRPNSLLNMRECQEQEQNLTAQKTTDKVKNP